MYVCEVTADGTMLAFRSRYLCRRREVVDELWIKWTKLSRGLLFRSRTNAQNGTDHLHPRKRISTNSCSGQRSKQRPSLKTPSILKSIP